MRPDKAKVTDEVWDDERIRSFLDKSPMGSEPNVDFSALLTAYRSMRAEDFGRFLEFFVAAGRDLHATSKSGHTLLVTIADHHNGGPFRDLLISHGAAH